MRRAVSRFAAPAAFLLAVTVALLLVRSGLRDEAPAAQRTATTAPVTTVERPTATRPPVAAARPAGEGQEFYEIRAGDTLATVADSYDTNVEALVGLNPGVDPTGLQVGQRIRVK